MHSLKYYALKYYVSIVYMKHFLPFKNENNMECRPGCAACCIVISISSPIPGMPNGKPAGVRCVNLADDLRCKIFGRPERPRICGAFQPDPLICGQSRTEAVRIMAELEELDPEKF